MRKTMLKKSMLKALNEQINAEVYSSYLYLSMAGYCETRDLAGMGNWFKVQAQEELVHSVKFFNYIIDRDGLVSLTAIAGPPTTWESPLECFKNALEHEQGVTARINKLVDLATKEGDNTTVTFLQWFVNEQIEEEATVRKLIGQLKLMGESGPGLFMLDRELATRTFVMPPATTAP
jgi:ferritin